ncbi:hypothetical protein ABPG74_021543 [Tetrahymena malaccensis]
MASNSVNNLNNTKSVAFQQDQKQENKDGQPKNLGNRERDLSNYKNKSQIASSPLIGSGKLTLKKKGQLNQLINPFSSYQNERDLKSSQGFYINEDLIMNPRNQMNHNQNSSSINISGVKVSSSSSLQQFGSSTYLNSNNPKYHSSHDIKLGIEMIGHRGANTSHMSGRDNIYQSNPNFGFSTLTSTNKKWSQEQVYTTFYKKRDNNEVILIPEKFWEQDKSFVPFKKIWADHEQINSQMVTQYIQKKQQLEQDDHKNQNHQEQEDLSQDYGHPGVNEYQKKTNKNNRGSSLDAAQKMLHLTNKQMKQKQGKNQNKYEFESVFKTHFQSKQQNGFDKVKNVNNLHLKIVSNQPGNHKEEFHESNADKSGRGVGSLSVIDDNINGKKNGTRNGFLPKMGNKHMQNSSMVDLTMKDEIELQLNQNRYSQNVYDAKIFQIEQQVYNDAYEKIQTNQQQLDKISKKTRVYNKHNIVESLDTQQVVSDKKSSIINNEREFAIQRPSIICCWIDNDQDTWKPQPRIGATLNIAGCDGKREMILIGGISSDMVKDVLVIDAESYLYDTLKHIQELKRQEQEDYKEEINKRKMNKERRLSKISKRNSLLYNVQLNGQNMGGSTPSLKKQKESSVEKSEKEKQQDYEDLFNKYLYGKDNFSQRYNHTTVEIYRRTKLLIFGGEILNNDPSHQAGQQRQKLRPHHRNCLNDLISFDMSTYEWRAHIGRGEIIEARRNHTATMVGQKHMVVIGGLNSEGRALDDLYILDINTFRWINIHVVHNKYVHPFTQGIAYHACCFVSEDENSSSINILGNGYYNLLNQNGNSHKEKKFANGNSVPTFIKEEGLYLFGGVDSTNNYIKNKMFVLKQNGNPPVWIELNTIGKSPDRRCGHSLNYMYNMSIIVIYGGKFESQNYTKYYDDLHVLNLKNLEWIQVNLEGNRKQPRAMHSTCINHKQLIVFGGLNDKGFLKGNIEIVEFDQMIVFKLKRQQNYSLSYHQELTSKQQIKMEDPLLLELMQKGDSKESNQPSTQQPSTALSMQKMKDRVFLIDPEQERIIKKNLDELRNAPHTDQPEEKWKPPQKSQSTNNLQANRFQSHIPLQAPQKTYLPLPLSILKKKDG